MLNQNSGSHSHVSQTTNISMCFCRGPYLWNYL